APAPAPAADAVPAEGSGRRAVLIGYGVAEDEGVPTRRHRRQGATPATPAATPAPAAPSPARAVRSTPPVRLYAKQHGLDIASIPGTGRDGLVTRSDVERALAGAPAPAPARAPSSPDTSTRFVGRDLAPWASGPAEERIPVRGVLRSMSEAMTQSYQNAPHAAVWMRVDATRTMELLASLKRHPALEGLRLSPLTIAAMAICDAARHFPGINSSFDAAAGEVVVRRSVNLGIAADTPRGLIVPNIKGADRLDIVSMARALNDLVDTARAGTTTPGDMLQTTLTITNVGPFGVDAAMPILPPGTGAILALGRFAPTPWVVDGAIVVRQVTELAMSFDHRQVDGALASRVIAHVAHYLEDPAPALIVG
ncbi:MAG: 2-oxo acid dehydrogenase subunit E2, partial [Acidobacteriota bacterium]|nr:2-oxo acid dehydrogenase subunit E2 [Acidobacteriota bacterium]